jgi:hypothetical protein
MGKVKKHICTNVPSSQTFRSHLMYYLTTLHQMRRLDLFLEGTTTVGETQF